MSKELSIKDLIKESKLPERSVTLCLAQGMTADFEVLTRQLEAMNGQPSAASLEGDPRRGVIQQMRELQARMAERSREFRFRALPRRAFTKLVAQYPPNLEDARDLRNGFAYDDVMEVLIKTCCILPVLDADDWSELLGREPDPAKPDDEGVEGILSSAQYDTIANLAWAVNRRDVNIPFLPADSELLQTS